MSKSPQVNLKFVFVGDSNCGKTSLFNRMSVNKFQPQNNFLSPDYAFSITKYSDKTVKITFWDTIAQEKYQLVKPQYYEKANVVFACFDLSNKILVENIQLWLDEIGKHMCEETFIAIVGCKGDIMEDEKNEKILMKIADKYEYQYFKTSSWLGEGIKDLMSSSLESCINAAENQNEVKKVNKPKKQQMKKVKIVPEINNAYSATSILRKSKEEQKEKEQELSESQPSQSQSSQTLSSQQSSQKFDKTNSYTSSKTSKSNQTKTITSTHSNQKSNVSSKQNSNPSQTISSRKPTPLSSQKSSAIVARPNVGSSDKILQYPQSD